MRLIVADKVKIKDVEVSFDFYDYRSGEHFFTAVASLDGVDAGHLKGSSYQDVVWVKWVEVTPEFQRRGVGKALYLALLEEFPEAVIKNSATTPEGTHLWKAVEPLIPKDRLWKPEPEPEEADSAWEQLLPGTEGGEEKRSKAGGSGMPDVVNWDTKALSSAESWLSKLKPSVKDVLDTVHVVSDPKIKEQLVHLIMLDPEWLQEVEDLAYHG